MDNSTKMTCVPLQESGTSDSLVQAMDIEVKKEVTSADPLYFIDTTPTSDFRINFKIDTIANYFGLNTSYSKIYHYDIEVKAVNLIQKRHKRPKIEGLIGTPELIPVSKEIAKEVVGQLLKLNKCANFRYIYDGERNLLTSIELPIVRECTFNIFLSADKKYFITIQPVTKYEGANGISLQFLQNTTMCNTSANNLMELNEIIDHRNMYTVPDFDRYFSYSHLNKIDLGKGLETWQGYEHRINLAQKGPTFVLNIPEIIFHQSGPVIDYVNELLRFDITNTDRHLERQEINRIKSALRGVKVKVENEPYDRHRYIEDITNTDATDTYMDDDDEMSVLEYHIENFGHLNYPHLPCIKLTVTTASGPNIVPFEICNIMENQLKSGYHETVTENMLSDGMKRLSLFVDFNPNDLQSHDVCPPELKCIEGSRSYSEDFKTRKLQTEFSKTSKKTSWVVLSFVDQSKLPLSKIAEFLCQLQEFGSEEFHFGRFMGAYTFEKHDSIEEIFHREEIRNAELALILLEEKNNNYDEIKFTANFKLGRVIQCVKTDTIYKLDSKIAKRICYRISMKLGGRSFQYLEKPKIFSQPIIIFGNVFSSVASKFKVACLVGSLDAYPSRYQVSCRIQDPQKENVVDLEAMVKTILKSFYQYTRGKNPEKIIFFSTFYKPSSFKTLIYREVSQIQKACKDIIGRLVPITFIDVAKKPHEILKDVNDGACAVSAPIKTRTSQDFLNYSFSPMGHIDPSYYTVIYDDSKFNITELREITKHMCKVYVGNAVIALPAPIRYAQVAADHAKKYINFNLSKLEDKTKLPDFVIDTIHKMEEIKNHMFFL